METPSVQQPVTEWFRADQLHPALVGYYRVRSSRVLSVHSRFRLTGPDLRYWDGARWLTMANGVPSVFGRHDSHEWCGLRRWVLSCRIAGVVQYLVVAKDDGTRWSTAAVDARPFASEVHALAYAKRCPNYPLSAILA